MILLADANVLIDLGHVGGLALLPRLGVTEVLDVVLLECDHLSQPDLMVQVEAAGIQVVRSQVEWVSAADAYRADPLSIQDTLNLFYAQTFQRTLLTNDKPLRESCDAHGVHVHGTLWLIDEAQKRGTMPNEELCRWLKVLPQHERRLPKAEVRRLSHLLGC